MAAAARTRTDDSCILNYSVLDDLETVDIKEREARFCCGLINVYTEVLLINLCCFQISQRINEKQKGSL